MYVQHSNRTPFLFFPSDDSLDIDMDKAISHWPPGQAQTHQQTNQPTNPIFREKTPVWSDEKRKEKKTEMNIRIFKPYFDPFNPSLPHPSILLSTRAVSHSR